MTTTLARTSERCDDGNANDDNDVEVDVNNEDVGDDDVAEVTDVDVAADNVFALSCSLLVAKTSLPSSLFTSTTLTLAAGAKFKQLYTSL